MVPSERYHPVIHHCHVTLRNFRDEFHYFISNQYQTCQETKVGKVQQFFSDPSSIERRCMANRDSTELMKSV